MITAVEIDELYYAEPIKTVTTPAAGLTGAEVATILKNAATKRVKNVHGDTYQYEEAEASVTRYKNALSTTGKRLNRVRRKSTSPLVSMIMLQRLIYKVVKPQKRIGKEASISLFINV